MEQDEWKTQCMAMSHVASLALISENDVVVVPAATFYAFPHEIPGKENNGTNV